MASIEDLPADQRAVLQMVLQRGRTYDEIASVLSIERSAVRQRALDACDTLTPAGIAPGPEQALVTDYLLSQLPEQVAEQVYVYLEAADDDRDWAHAIAGHLDQLASGPLPQIPAAAPLHGGEPPIPDDAYAPYEDTLPEPEFLATPHTPAPAARASVAGRTERGGSSPPRRGYNMPLLVLGLVAAIVVVVVIIVATTGGSSPGKPHRIYTYTQATSTTVTGSNTATSGTTAGTEPQMLAALNLTSPVGATQTLGVAQVVRDDGVVGVVIDAQGVPANSAHNAYGVWLYNSASSNRFVGFDANLVGKNGRLAIEGTLPAGAAGYKHLLITLETQPKPKTPGEVVLSGPFREK